MSSSFPDETHGQYHTSPQAIVLPIFAAIVSLLIIPLLIFHIQARNFALTVLILGITLLNIQNVVNPIIWRDDNVPSWWSGEGLCDVEAKLQIGISVALPSAAACLFRQLALILDTSRTGALPSSRAQLYGKIFERIVCLALPVYLMSIHVLVQPYRYFISNISGCQYSLDSSYMSNVLVLIWPVLASLVGTSYSGIVVFRLLRYRQEVSTILSHSSMKKSHFLRLFLIAAVFIVVYTPLSIYTFASNLEPTWSGWTWQRVHPPGWDKYIIMRVDDETAVVDRWIQVATGCFILIIFGTASDVKSMYRQWVAAAKLPSLLDTFRRK